MTKFSQSKFFGFCGNLDSEELFFHVSDFHKLNSNEPPPILGELVEVSQISRSNGNRQKASHVQRVSPPTPGVGVIRSFDHDKGWGFLSLDGSDVFLHRSEMAVQCVPVVGMEVTFFVGGTPTKPRACWVRPK